MKKDDMMRGQYFSFDAIVATIIMAFAFSSLIVYWEGAYQIIDSKANSRLSDANRIAEMLLSPGSPEDWEESAGIGQIRQLGIADGFGNRLDKSKVEAMRSLASSHYQEVGRLIRAGGEYRIVIEYSDVENEAPIAEIGAPAIPESANYVAVANRGITYLGRPGRMRVFLWK